MYIITDLQIHSKFSRAVSKDMVLPKISAWAKRKGISIMATGDWTHPMWMREIVETTTELENGFLTLKDSKGTWKDDTPFGIVKEPLFMLATEVSCIYTQNGKGRRVHTLIWVPTLTSAQKISREMTRQGCNLLNDGRPIIGLTSIQVAELVFSIEPNALVIPAHAWTPWFSVFGSMSGFDSIKEAFGPFADRIYAIETGLSSNPAMNWEVTELDTRTILSFSDAHSGAKLGREATVFETTKTMKEFGYQDIYDAIVPIHKRKDSKKNTSSVAYTIEFYPEEGKYHYSGHRACNIRWGPDETRAKGISCPVCGKPLTQGVVQRVSELSGRKEKDLKLIPIDFPIKGEQVHLHMTKSETYPARPPFVMQVPLQEIIAECIGSPVASKKTQAIYETLTNSLGSEFRVLLVEPIDAIKRVAGDRVGMGIEKVRRGDINIDPGYDGVFGVVKIWKEGEEKPLIDASKEQLSIF